MGICGFLAEINNSDVKTRKFAVFFAVNAILGLTELNVKKVRIAA